MLVTLDDAAEKYALALFDLGEEAGNLEKIKGDLSLMDSVLENDEELKKFMANPFVKKDARKKFLLNVFQGKIEGISLNFLMVLAEKKLERLLPLIVKKFNSSFYASRGVVEVKIITARPLDAATYAVITERLSRAMKKQIAVSTRIDKTILGGAVLQIGDRLVDGSVARRFREFEALARGVEERTKGKAVAR
jgi:F-type H+-transporting ATPase subunit delta